MQNPAELEFHPIDMREFGKNPAGLPLYRVVKADSRVTKLLYEGVIHDLPMYGEMPLTYGKWVLEKWLSPDKYVGLTAAQWEELFTTGPFAGAPKEEYPSEGEYEIAHIFEGHVDSEQIKMAIRKTESNINLTPQQMKQVRLRREQEKAEATKAKKSKMVAEIFDTPQEKVGIIYG